MIKLSLVILIFLGVFSRLSTSARVVCYFPSWAKLKPGNEKYQTANVDPNICTHIIYAYASVNEIGEVVQDDDWIKTVIEIDTLNYFKEKNPDLKVLLSLGGWEDPSSTFSQVAADASKLKTLLHDAYNSVGLYGVDGLDIHWEYPGQRGGDAENDAANFVNLLSEFRPVMDMINGAIFSVSVTGNEESMKISYPDAKAISDSVDMINVLPFNETVKDGIYKTPKLQELSIVSDVKRWIDGGADPAKLNLGLNTYGRVLNSEGTEGEAVGFNTICQLGTEWEDSWDEDQQVPIKTDGTQKIIYENTESLGIKADMIKDLKIGGAAVWSLDTDDFHANCGPFYPLINTIKDHVN